MKGYWPLSVCVAVCVSVFVVSCAGSVPMVHVAEPTYWPTTGWRTSTPEAQGLDSDKLAAMLMTIRQRGIPIHSLQVIRNGYVVLDAYFYPFQMSTLHDT